jgi:hypothetical protein
VRVAEPGKLILASDLDTDEARMAIGRTLAAIEEDCSKSWPQCPHTGELICVCRLQATRAINALKFHLKLW